MMGTTFSRSRPSQARADTSLGAMASLMEVDGDPLERLRASAAARAAAPPEALDVIASFGQRALTDAVLRAPPMPQLLERNSPWLQGLACDTQLWRDPSFCLAPLAAQPLAQPQLAPFDLQALQAAFTFRPSVMELAESDKGAPLLAPAPPAPPPVPMSAAEAEAEAERRERKERKKKEKKEKRKREGEATGMTGSGDESEGSKRTKSGAPLSSPTVAAPPAQPRRAPAAAPRRDRDRSPRRDRDRDRERERDRERDRPRARSPLAAPVYTGPLGPAPIISLAEAVPRGYAVEPACPTLSAALIGRRVAMKGVGSRGESWCWGVIKQFYKPPTCEGWNFEVAWGGGCKEIRDCRLHPDFYSTDPEAHADLAEAWVLLAKL